MSKADRKKEAARKWYLKKKQTEEEGDVEGGEGGGDTSWDHEKDYWKCELLAKNDGWPARGPLVPPAAYLKMVDNARQVIANMGYSEEDNGPKVHTAKHLIVTEAKRRYVTSTPINPYEDLLRPTDPPSKRRKTSSATSMETQTNSSLQLPTMDWSKLLISIGLAMGGVILRGRTFDFIIQTLMANINHPRAPREETVPDNQPPTTTPATNETTPILRTYT